MSSVATVNGTTDGVASHTLSGNLSRDSDDSVGLSDPHLSYGRRRTLDLVNRLHSTGVQVDLDLPVIAVIGNQSAGKSSLIESISGIKLPRAAGTCTRCPIECKLSYSDEPWVCKVSLRFVADEKGQPLGQVRNELFGPAITNRDDVEERIRRAQRAILNPSLPSEHFLRSDDEDPEQGQLTFSSNCVSLQISGKDIADLSFVDLPGLIATSIGKDADINDISLVENLVTSYIKKESCMILLTVACETDFENQGAHQLAKMCDPEGKRTVGVLTKPDRIQDGEHEQWLPFIRNVKEPLRNNWFCVKQPNPSALRKGITWQQARKEEDSFFSSVNPWASLESTYQRFLRTSNLTERLSFILSDLISKRLPEIEDELQQLIDKTDQEISQLPKPPSKDPQREVNHMILMFMSGLSRHLEGIATKDGLLQQIRPAQETFRQQIYSTAPDFRPYERRFSFFRSMPPAPFLPSDSDKNLSADKREGEQKVNPLLPASWRVKDEKPTAGNQNAIYIDEVFDRAAHSRTRELPDIYPFVVYESFIKDIVQAWRKPCLELFNSVQATVGRYIREVVRGHFEAFGNGAMHHKVQRIVADHIKMRADEIWMQLERLLRKESRPLTKNTHDYSEYKDKFLSYYRSVRRDNDTSSFIRNVMNYQKNTQFPAGIDQKIDDILSGLAQIGSSGLKADDLAKLFPADPFEPALEIMATIRAYFQVVLSRFEDCVALEIEAEFIPGLVHDLEDTLSERLGISGPKGYETCKELVQENPAIAAHREELRKKQERLRVASDELLGIGGI